jgi:hypothetical protein
MCWLHKADPGRSESPRRTAIRCDFLLASKMALGTKYAKDRISDLAQRELLFYVLRDREVLPNRTGKKFFCCPNARLSYTSA